MKYYNGRPTIKSKVKLASEQVSGIMIWELGQDSFSDYSLLKTIHKEYNNLGFKTSGLCLD
jgi:GH18 family chitinase